MQALTIAGDDAGLPLEPASMRGQRGEQYHGPQT